MSNPEVAACNHPANLLGILVVFCVDGERKEEWVDLKKVHSISWCDGEMKAKGKGNGNPSGPKLPKGSPPGTCKKKLMSGPGAPMCWWDGTKWECGETQE